MGQFCRKTEKPEERIHRLEKRKAITDIMNEKFPDNPKDMYDYSYK